MRLGILGSNGRMGQAIAELVALRGTDDVQGIDKDGDPAELAARCDVLIDFSTPAALKAHLDAARQAGTPIMIGTTGLDLGHHLLIDAAAEHIAVLQAANTSVGINVLAALVHQAAARLGPDWDIEVLEMHHRHKVDAPSGTGLLLAQAAANGRGRSLPELSRFDRFESSEPREEGTIGFASLRGGSVAGDHVVIFAAEGERLELGHRAESREIFAKGAVAAAVWLAAQVPGRYTMTDMLGL